VVRQGGRLRRQTVSIPVFSSLPVQDQLLHNVASPASAYLLFVIGMALIVFELFTAGVGVAGLVGAGVLVLGCYGLFALPTNPVGVVLLLLAMFGYAVDVQTGVPRVWSGIAVVSFTVGSVILYDGLSLSWITLLVAIGGIAVAMIGGMPAMVRTRFSTPTIGREWMIGEVGLAQGRVAPDGIVTVRDAPWRARTNRATPIEAGDDVRVVSIDGLLLEVEPLEGAARDHRDRGH
jgi:membrane-bound serine protease (ClpP class)